MSLINKVAVSNLSNMNGKGSQVWEPRFHYEVLNFHGQSVAMNLINGGGKTTLAEAMLAILSKDKKLVSNTKAKFSPLSKGVWSHVQVELIMPRGNTSQNDMLINMGDEVNGEQWVFGMCGYRGETTSYYYYQGALNDLPIGKKQDNKTILTSNKQFRDIGKAIKGMQWGVQGEEWTEVMGRHLSLDGIRQLVTFQKKGGSDKSAQIFDFKQRSGESYGEAFFYEVLAPAIMTDMMNKESEDGEHQLEDTIYETIMRVVRAKRKTEYKREVVKRQEACSERLDIVAAAAENAVEKQDKYQKSLKQMAVDVHVLTHLTLKEPIPGIPKNNLPEGMVGDLAKNVVIAPGEDIIRVTDSGLSVLIGKSTKHINEIARRNSIEGRKMTQVIEIPSDLKLVKELKHGGARYTSTLYTIKQIKELLQSTTKYTNNLTPSKAIEIIEDVETWFERDADTNPYRKELIDAKVDLEYNIKISQETQSAIEKLLEEKEYLIIQQREIKENEAIYNDLCKSGLFSNEELAVPQNTGEEVLKEYEEANKALNDFKMLAAQLSILKGDWFEFRKLHVDSNPHEIDKEYVNKKGEIENIINELNSDMASLDDESNELEASIRGVEKKIDNKESTLTRFDELSPGILLFKSRFIDGTDPIGLDRKLIEEYANLKRTRDESEKKRVRYERGISYINEFNKFVSEDVSPNDWLNDVNSERENLTIIRQEITTNTSILKRKRNALEKENIAASSMLQQAIDVLNDNKLSHTTVHKLILDLDVGNKLKRSILSSFSSLLFAPVFESTEKAFDAVELLSSKELSVPVFLYETLKQYCENEKIELKVDGRLYVGIHAGIETREVKCLLDPALVEREKIKLDNNIKINDNKVNKASERLNEISPEGELVVAAREAMSALDGDVINKRTKLIEFINNIEDEINNLKLLVSDDVIDAIKDVQKFVKLGGDKALLEIKNEINCLSLLREEGYVKYKDLSVLIKGNKLKIEEMSNEFNNVYPVELQKTISQAIVFWDKKGPEFISLEKERGDILQAAYNSSSKKNEFGKFFIRAQSYLDALAVLDSDNGIDKRISFIVKSIENKKNERIKASDIAKNLQTNVLPQLREIVKSIDDSAYNLIAKYKKVELLSDDILVSEIELYDLDNHEIWSSGHELRKVIKGIEAEDKKRLVTYAQMFSDNVADMNIEDSISSIKQAKKEAEDTKSEFIREAHTASGMSEGFAPSEKERLSSVQSVKDASRIESFCREYIAILHKEQDELTELERGEEGTRRDVADHTAFMIHQASHSLETLQRVVKRNHGGYKSHFIVEAIVLDRKGAAALIERISVLLDTQEKHRQEDKEKGTTIENDGVYKDNLRAKIRDQVYRSIFSNPIVKFVNERIRTKGQHEFDEDLSEGEKTALALMWTIRLAEFAIERETRKLRTNTARQKARSRAENILIIDGLFSNLSEPALIKSVMSGIEGTRGRFQLIGLMHHPHYENDFNVFPVLLIGKKHETPGGGAGWVSFSNGKPVLPEEKGNKEGSVGFAQITRVPEEVVYD